MHSDVRDESQSGKDPTRRPPTSRQAASARNGPGCQRRRDRSTACWPRSLKNAFGRLLPDLKTIPITRTQIFYRQGDPVEKVYFPNGGVAGRTRLHFETALSH